MSDLHHLISATLIASNQLVKLSQALALYQQSMDNTQTTLQSHSLPTPLQTTATCPATINNGGGPYQQQQQTLHLQATPVLTSGTQYGDSYSRQPVLSSTLSLPDDTTTVPGGAKRKRARKNKDSAKSGETQNRENDCDINSELERLMHDILK